ncbi:WD40-repeat-containing domain protein [Hygrophoropsis aurantiaca]|uniref:WD40-repeat-containing domain protein n=1 Tax=Hygrophoropsis aurantiaca TaxID=72124 RepID=A0ACB8AMU2_9AGAM|nr:WD40-repeat-containing domain protein [Hygrophoropsis aurantiaca]
MYSEDNITRDFIRPPTSTRALPSFSRSQQWRRRRLRYSLNSALDRVNVLGGDGSGHTGCVNALSWAQDGELLISSGDDTQIRVWRMNPSTSNTQADGEINEYPFICQSVIHTGHSQNIFNAQMLPYSTRIATAAGDKQIRVFDIGEAVGRSPTGDEMIYNTRQSCLRVLRCHTGRTKRIVTEDSPDLFLTVAEDGEVRQHDLRTPHVCSSGGCSAPLVKLPHELSTITLSPLSPYQFVVGGESPYAHLFDRRHAGRYLHAEWGVPVAEESVTTCVRRFGRRSRARGERKGYEHITGARMSPWNGHEVAYSSDAVYLYSTRDVPEDRETASRSPSRSAALPNPKRRKIERSSQLPESDTKILAREEPSIMVDGTDEDPDDSMDDSDEGSNDDSSEAEEAEPMMDRVLIHEKIPIIYPRSRFAGHCNIETVKDVNFLGPQDEYVASGSDDGNFFIWKKSNGNILNVLEGDGNVVNVIEGHPHLPLIAVSGIDTTVKLFAPTHGLPEFSRMHKVQSVMKRNARTSRRGLHTTEMELAHLVLHYDRALQALRSAEDGGSVEATPLTECINQ